MKKPFNRPSRNPARRDKRKFDSRPKRDGDRRIPSPSPKFYEGRSTRDGEKKEWGNPRRDDKGGSGYRGRDDRKPWEKKERRDTGGNRYGKRDDNRGKKEYGDKRERREPKPWERKEGRPARSAGWDGARDKYPKRDDNRGRKDYGDKPERREKPWEKDGGRAQKPWEKRREDNRGFERRKDYGKKRMGKSTQG